MFPEHARSHSAKLVVGWIQRGGWAGCVERRQQSVGGACTLLVFWKVVLMSIDREMWSGLCDSLLTIRGGVLVVLTIS